MKLDDIKSLGKNGLYFQISQGKTESAIRNVPLHPKIIELGFDNYINQLKASQETWLFPDLKHNSRHGPGHQFSKWWGDWMDKHDLSDPALTHHGWRHTWKRGARVSTVKEEVHNVISGHADGHSTGRDYGMGADVEDLVPAMEHIDFPTFPIHLLVDAASKKSS